jgi:hypothetical protein
MISMWLYPIFRQGNQIMDWESDKKKQEGAAGVAAPSCLFFWKESSLF